jgi:hypothetical protein
MPRETGQSTVETAATSGADRSNRRLLAIVVAVLVTVSLIAALFSAEGVLATRIAVRHGAVPPNAHLIGHGYEMYMAHGLPRMALWGVCSFGQMGADFDSSFFVIDLVNGADLSTAPY